MPVFFFLSFLIPFVSYFHTPENKQVIAVQALFQEEEAIDSLWQQALLAGNVTSARTYGSRPHMTIASFSLTDGEIERMEKAFVEMDGQFPSHTFEVRLSVRKGNRGTSYYLVPVTEDSVLIGIHDALYKHVDKDFERYRKIDEPGSWWPHISMFEVRADSTSIPAELIREVEKIQTVTLKGFAMVRFGPIQYFREIETHPLKTAGKNATENAGKESRMN